MEVTLRNPEPVPARMGACSGGIILAVAPDRADVEGIMEHDPFVREGVATFEIQEFRASLHHPDLVRFADPGTRPARRTS
jgi:hypothetical protein